MPIDILTAAGTSVALLNNVLKSVKQMYELYDSMKQYGPTLVRIENSMMSLQSKLNAWRSLWMMRGRRQIDEETYKYFWTPEGYEKVLQILKTINIYLRELELLMYDYLDSKEKSFLSKLGFVVFKQDNAFSCIANIRSSIKDLATFTRIQFWSTVKGTEADEPIDHWLPLELSMLQKQSLRLWDTLEDIYREMPRSVMVTSREAHPGSLWPLLRSSVPMLDIKLGFIHTTDLLLCRFRHEVNEDIGDSSIERRRGRDRAGQSSRERSRDLTQRRFKQIGEPAAMVIGANLPDYFDRITKSSPRSQKALRHQSYLDRCKVASDIAQWAIIAWNSEWTDRLCICKIYYFFSGEDDTFSHPFVSMATSEAYDDPEQHACLGGSRSRKRLGLAVVLASLALACQIAVVNLSSRSLRFIAYIEGQLRNMDETELVRCVYDYTKGEYWHAAVKQCLGLSKQRVEGDLLQAADFERYDKAVLQLLEKNYKEVYSHRTESAFGRGQTRSSHNLHTLTMPFEADTTAT